MKKIIGMVILYLLAFVIIVAAVFCGIRLYKEIKAESYINGSIDISNRFTQESFNYSSTSAVFYHDLYDDTDQVILNDYVLLNTEINAGSVFATVNMDFYDTNGNVINSAVMKLSVKFLSNKTTLTLATTGKENASFLEQYFADNGIRLRIIEIL